MFHGFRQVSAHLIGGGQRLQRVLPLRQRASFLFAKSVLLDTSERAELSHHIKVEVLCMEKSNLIVETPHGASIHKTEDGQFKVCDGENNCRITRTLYSAEQELGVRRRGFRSLTQPPFIWRGWIEPLKSEVETSIQSLVCAS